jgi:hypothetical protein
LLDGKADVRFPLLNSGLVQRKEALAVEQEPVKMAVLPLQMLMLSAVGYLNLKTPNTDLSQNLVKDEDLPLATKLETLASRFNDFSSIVFSYEDFSEGKINQLEKTTQQNIYMDYTGVAHQYYKTFWCQSGLCSGVC